MNSFYWHDYETWGANPSIDRPSQFAGVRTDLELNIIEDPLVMYCQPPEDLWPQPMACLITGITPQHARQHGLPEYAFIHKIHAAFSQPGTCGVGYNTLRFDDEVTRYILYRNFYDPYEREWQNGNSRWDIIDMVRLVYALRPEGIEWPMVNGKPSFKLENLSVANGITHAAAHDAFSDVEATIAMAKLVKQKQPGLYDYVLQHRLKNSVASLIDVANKKPLLHVSSRFPSSRGCAGIIAPLAWHPVNRNAVIVYDLSVDPSPLLHLDAEEIRQRVFVSTEDLPEGQERLPIKLVYLNKCPVLTTTKLITPAVDKRLGLNKAKCEQHWQMMRQWNLAAKLQEMYRLDNFQPYDDPETQLYNGFIEDRDKALMADVRAAGASIVKDRYVFDDARLNQILWRYRARHYFSQLSPSEQEDWREFVQQRLFGDSKYLLNYTQLMHEISQLESDFADNREKIEILQQLKLYAEELKAKYAPNLETVVEHRNYAEK